MIIRDAIPHEIPYIREQRIVAYSEHAQSLPIDHWKALKKALSSDVDIQTGVELIVAEVDGEIFGSVALFPPNTNAYEGFIEKLEHSEIRLLAVSPAARGKGVASALVQECIKRTKAKGYDAIGLHTGEFMKNAMALYEKIGFERLPKYDFEPANDGIVVKAFRLEI